MSDSDRRARANRRDLLAACGATLAAAALGPPARGQTRAPLPAQGLPDAWGTAESLPLWRDAPPGARGFAARPGPDRFPPGFLHNVARPELKVFRPSASNGRALMSIPGGGYSIVSVLNEGLQVAARMATAGYTVFVLVYRLPGEGWDDRSDVPLQDAQRAMRVIRSQASRYGFDPAQIAAVGFSAGGHLAASLATGFAEPVYAPRDATDRLDARPAATGLIYPVIALDGPLANRGSAIALLGSQPSPELVARRSPAQHVAPSTPPLFLTHAVDDRTVPMQNSILMLEAMTAAQRPVEAHLFPAGGHGFGLGRPGSQAAEWPALFTSWLESCFAT